MFIGDANVGAEQTASIPTTQPADDATANSTATVPTRSIAFNVHLVEATIVTDDVATGRQWRLQNVSVQYDTHGIVGSATGNIMVSDHGGAAIPAGRFALSLKSGENGRQQLSFQADQVALAMAEPWLRRFAAGSELSGTLNGQASATWTLTSAAFPKES